MNGEEIQQTISKLQETTKKIAEMKNVLKETGEKLDSIFEIKKFVKLMQMNRLLMSYASLSCEIAVYATDKLKEHALRPPCHECGFDGGDMYHSALEDFQFTITKI